MINDRESVVTMRPDDPRGPMVTEFEGGKFLRERKLAVRDDLHGESRLTLALSILCWFFDEQTAIDAAEQFHVVHIANLEMVPGAGLHLTGEQVFDWLLEWKESKKPAS